MPFRRKKAAIGETRKAKSHILILKAKRYRLQGRDKIQGMNISIENRKGSVRKGKDKDGNVWKTKMKIPYGYIRNTEASDNQHVDCFIGPDKSSRLVYVVHIVNPKTKKYDEDKVFLGFNDPDKVHDMFYEHYDDGDKYFHSMDEMTIGQFKEKAFSKKYKGKMIKSREEVTI